MWMYQKKERTDSRFTTTKDGPEDGNRTEQHNLGLPPQGQAPKPQPTNTFDEHYRVFINRSSSHPLQPLQDLQRVPAPEKKSSSCPGDLEKVTPRRLH